MCRSENFLRRNLLPLTVIFILCVIVRLPLISIPLDRDEGCYAYIAQHILSGELPYRDIFDHKPPLVYAMYAAAFTFLPMNIQGIHTFLAIILFIGAAAIFFIARRLTCRTSVGLTASCAFLVFSSVPIFEGNSANTEQFANLWSIFSIFFTLRFLSSKRESELIFAGFSAGLSFLTKYPMAVLLPFLFAIVIASAIKNRREIFSVPRSLFSVFIGFCVPIFLTAAFFYCNGALKELVDMTVTYNRFYVSGLTFSLSILWFVPIIVDILFMLFPVVVLMFLGCVVQLFKPADKGFLLSLGWFFISFIAALSGVYGYRHYFVFLIPSLAIGFAYTIYFISPHAKKNVVVYLLTATLFLLPFLKPVFHSYNLPPESMSRILFPREPFLESVYIGGYLKERTRPSDTIFVFGSEPQIYFYAGRSAPGRYVYTYPFFNGTLSAAQMQEELIRDIERKIPEYIVHISKATSHLASDESELKLVTYLERLIKERYECAGYFLPYGGPGPGCVFVDAADAPLKVRGERFFSIGDESGVIALYKKRSSLR